MKRAKLSVVVRLEHGGDVDFPDKVEISIPCFICVRTDRTVILNLGQDEGICAKQKHSIRGRLLEKKIEQNGGIASVTYRLEYVFKPFIDLKYGHPASPLPTWARVEFKVRCSKCGLVVESGTQSNISRPWEKRCPCGSTLFKETEEMPRIEMEESEAR